MTLDDDGAFWLFALNDIGHRVPVETCRDDLADEGLVLTLLVLKANGVVDVGVRQLDEDLLVDIVAIGEKRGVSLSYKIPWGITPMRFFSDRAFS